MRKPIVLDLETKHTFHQYNDLKKLGVSVVGVYDYQENKLKSFLEKEINNLFPLLEKSSLIIGFNIKSFDLPVLQSYYPGEIDQFPIFDILEDIKKTIGRRLALNDVLLATLGKKKTGHGLQAINYYQEGKIDQLKKYCLDDVLLTKELFDYGVKNGEILYLDSVGKSVIKVDWKKYLNQLNNNKNISLTLPF